MARRPDPEAENARYLAMRLEGSSFRDIAKACGVSYRTVYVGVQRAKEAEAARRSRPWWEIEAAKQIPSLQPFFPPGQFTPATRCNCAHNPIPKGSRRVCLVCHKSGLDHLPVFRDAKPLPKDLKPAARKARLTRKEERELRRLVRQLA